MQQHDWKSLPEFLEDKENQKVVLERIVEALRGREEWGRHGLFAALAKELGFSAAYVGRVLTGRNPLRENFVIKMSDYLKVSITWIRGEVESDYEGGFKEEQFFHEWAEEIFQRWLQNRQEEKKIEAKDLDATRKKISDLYSIFCELTIGEMDSALRAMQNMRNTKEKLAPEMRKHINNPPVGE